MTSPWRKAMAPPEDRPIWQWAEEHIYLSPRQPTAFPGQYRSALTPYVRGIFDALQSPKYWLVTVMKGAQTGLTLLSHIWVAHNCHQNPAPTLIVFPNEKQAQSVSETRIQPLFQDSPALAELIPAGRDSFKKLEYRLKGALVNLVGANSPAQLATRPIRDLVLDEVDKYKREQVREASAPSLAIQRTKTYFNRTIFEISTPTTSEEYINTQFEASDKQYFEIPCKKCGKKQRLVWAQVKFDKDAEPNKAAAESYYECIYCQDHWSDQDKIAALDKGEWVASAQAIVKGHIGFHLSSMYAPWVKWADLVGKWLKVKDTTSELKDFINSDLGEPWKESVETVADDVLFDRQAEYSKGERISESEKYKDIYIGKETTMILTADVQKNHHWYVAREWIDGGDSGLVEWGYSMLLEDLRAKDLDIKANVVFIDNGYRERAQEVYDACVDWKWMPTIGSGNIGLVFKKRMINPYEGKVGGKSNNLKIEEVTYDDNYFQGVLMNMADGTYKAWRVYKHFTNEAGMVINHIEPEYVKQVMSEEKVDGKWQHKRGHPNNHLRDCEKLQILAAMVPEKEGATPILRSQWVMPEGENT